MLGIWARICPENASSWLRVSPPRLGSKTPFRFPRNSSRENATYQTAAFGIRESRGGRPKLGALQTGSSRPEQSSSSWADCGKAA